MLGLELEDARACAVRLDDRGKVQARAAVDAQGDLAAAATRALAEVSGAASGARPRLLGVAAVHPESPSITAVVARLAKRFTGPFTRTGATPSGTASAIAETWIGAARGS